MNLNKIAATAAMAGGLGAAAFGIGAGFAQAAPGPDVPGPSPSVPGPNVPAPNGQVPPGQLPGPNGQGIGNGPKCEGQGANALCPGSPLPPGQERNGVPFPPPGHYNDPVRYGLPATWAPDGVPEHAQPVVFNPDVDGGQWGVQTSTGFQAYTPAGGANGGVNGTGNVGTPGT